jgi:proteasome lid subunit RPN8/RPN11
VQAIEAHAQETFPEECCGFLLGPATEPRKVADLRRATNVVEANRERRYVIDPREILAAEKEVAGTGREILGFYHSHPNHPAEPSEFDRSHAWPWYSYVILSIVDRKPADLRAWLLDGESSVFAPDTLTVE